MNLVSEGMNGIRGKFLSKENKRSRPMSTLLTLLLSIANALPLFHELQFSQPFDAITIE